MAQKGFLKSRGFFTVSLALLAFSPDAEGRHFKVYGYQTPGAGETEIVYWTDYVAGSDRTMTFFDKTGVDREGLLAHTVEVEYGVTDRYTVAGYLDFEQPSGEEFKYIQARAVAGRYRFGERGDRFFDTALYVEYYLPDPQYAGKAKEKVEVRLILEKKLRVAVLRLNPELEKVMSGPDVGEGMEFEYGASLYAGGGGRIRPGVELYGKLGELANVKSPDLQEHYVVPAVTWKLTDHLGWNLGAAVGLTDASDNWVIKSILEWEP